MFVREDDGRFRRFTETHLQRGYTLEQMSSLVRKAGLEILEVTDADTGGELRPESERVLVAAQKRR